MHTAACPCRSDALSCFPLKYYFFIFCIFSYLGQWSDVAALFDYYWMRCFGLRLMSFFCLCCGQESQWKRLMICSHKMSISMWCWNVDRFLCDYRCVLHSAHIILKIIRYSMIVECEPLINSHFNSHFKWQTHIYNKLFEMGDYILKFHAATNSSTSFVEQQKKPIVWRGSECSAFAKYFSNLLIRQ